MRSRLVLAVSVLVASSVACAADDTWTLSTATDVRYFNWFGNLGVPANGPQPRASGDELYTPYAFELVGRPSNEFKIDILARGGGVWARQFTEGLSGEVNTNTDSAVAGTVTYYGWNGIQPFVSLNMNLPTGDPVLAGLALNARMNPDLVDIATFGEGFNLGPTVGFNLPLTTNLLLTASAGYTWRGSYDQDGFGARTIIGRAPCSPFPGPCPTIEQISVPVVNRVDPGEVFTVTGAIGYQVGQLQLTVTGAFSQETATTQNDGALYDPGNRFFGTADLSYTWANNGGVTFLNVSATHTEKNDVRFGTVAQVVCDDLVGPPIPSSIRGNLCNQTIQDQNLQHETSNSNSDFFRLGLEHRFTIGQLSIGPTASVLLRESNGYAPGTIQFIPEAQRWAVGAAMSYPITNKATFNLRADHVWLNQGGRPNGCTTPAVSGGNNVPDIPGQPGMTSALLGNSCVPASAQAAVSENDWQGVVGLSIQF